jgi:hypothetical protein
MTGKSPARAKARQKTQLNDSDAFGQWFKLLVDHAA